MFQVEILAFEDQGAVWEMAFEDVARFQFRRGAKHLSVDRVSEYQAIAERLGRWVQLSADPVARSHTEELIRAEQDRVKVWLSGRVHVPGRIRQHLILADRRGDPDLKGILHEYLEMAGLVDIEVAFARAYASNPHAGEVVRGHELVLARLGLVP